MKRFFALTLALVLTVSAFPFCASATGQTHVRDQIADIQINGTKNHETLDPQRFLQLHNIGDHRYTENEPNNDVDIADVVYHDITLFGSIGAYDMDWFYFELPTESEITVLLQAGSSSVIHAIYDSTGENILYVAEELGYSNGYYYDLISCTLAPGEYHMIVIDLDGSYYTDYMYYFEALPTGSYSHTHNYSVTIIDPTCITDGYTMYSCSCGDYFTDDFIPSTGVHIYDDGLDQFCNICNQYRHVHTYIPQVISTPNCLNQGQIIYICSCGLNYIEAQAALGHVYADFWDVDCEVCGAQRIVDPKRPTHSMYRMYNPNSGEHFYTGSMEERLNLISAGWKYEGVGFTFPVSTGAPVYRLYDKYNTMDHLYTMDEEEMNILLSHGWVYEGIAFNSGNIDEVPQYRLHNPNTTIGAYHFTASIEERDSLIAAGWDFQGIGFYTCLQ